MKAVVVIDMPKDCHECPCFRVENDFPTYYGEYCSVTRKGLSGERPLWCPLRLLPSFKAVDLNDTRDVVMFCHGWNTCLAEITGDSE